MKRLDDRVVVVTGGSRGLGGAIAIEAAREGARVVVGYRRRERDASATVEEIGELGKNAIALSVDVREAASVDAFFARVLDAHGRVDGLVTSAGIVLDAWAATLPLDQWDDTIATNLRGTFLCARAALRPMMAQKRGSIVALASVAGLHASPGQASYAASKGGILALVRTLAAEVGRHGVRVNALAPGVIDAGMVKATSQERVQALRDRVPLGRLGEADEIAKCATFLLSDDAGYVTGHTLVADGGMSA